LAAFLASIAAGFPNADSKILIERANEELRLLIAPEPEGELLPGALSLVQDDDAIASWMGLGDALSRTYGIEQFALINWSD